MLCYFTRLFIFYFHNSIHRHNFIIKFTRLLTGSRSLLTNQRILILCLSRNIVATRNNISRLDHWVPKTWIPAIKLWLYRLRGITCTWKRNTLNATCYHDIYTFSNNPSRAHCQRLKSRRTEAINSGTRSGHWTTGCNRRVSSNIHSRRTRMGRITKNDIVNL